MSRSIYEAAEVAAFLEEDAAALRTFIGLTDESPGLRLMESA